MNEEIKSAAKMRKFITENQVSLVYKQILDAAIKGKMKILLTIDFMLSDACKSFFSRLGYNVLETHTLEEKEQLRYLYEISWR